MSIEQPIHPLTQNTTPLTHQVEHTASILLVPTVWLLPHLLQEFLELLLNLFELLPRRHVRLIPSINAMFPANLDLLLVTFHPLCPVPLRDLVQPLRYGIVLPFLAPV